MTRNKNFELIQSFSSKEKTNDLRSYLFCVIVLCTASKTIAMQPCVNNAKRLALGRHFAHAHAIQRSSETSYRNLHLVDKVGIIGGGAAIGGALGFVGGGLLSFGFVKMCETNEMLTHDVFTVRKGVVGALMIVPSAVGAYRLTQENILGIKAPQRVRLLAAAATGGLSLLTTRAAYKKMCE